ncbi:unnamed protein product [Paramecium octaurelia]|uniref:Uncharacterized protein n=1 Tax=Paramecium octaurelia TaxID=43137 RepID=A0A8S1UFX1_PAROT|nr:unnamed protein product [Paramecium octaurelia]
MIPDIDNNCQMKKARQFTITQSTGTRRLGRQSKIILSKLRIESIRGEDKQNRFDSKLNNQRELRQVLNVHTIYVLNTLFILTIVNLLEQVL